MHTVQHLTSSLPKWFLTATFAACVTACGGGGGDINGGNESSHSDNRSGSAGSNGNPSGFATSTNAATSAVSGQALYAAYCATCHGASFAEAKDYASTLSAIARNKGGMGYLSASIQTAQANDIATYLSYGVTAPTAPTSPTTPATPSTPPTPAAPTTPTLSTQTISFTSPGDQVMGGKAPALIATASSGLALSFSSNTPTVCLPNGTALDLLSVGTCSLTASQLGNVNFAAALPVNVSFAITAAMGPALRAQTISFSSPGNLVLDNLPHNLVATASSGLLVNFASATTSVCRISGTTLTLRMPGTCTVVANQAGDTAYAAAPTVSNSFYAVASTAADGKIAYNLVISGQSCAGCHGVPGAVATSRILAAANADVVLNSAINNNIGGMGLLIGRYTQQQILDISAYLATPGL